MGNLKDISKRSDFKEITAKGGSRSTEKTRAAMKIVHSGRTKCKNCKLDCDYRERSIKRDSECTCAVPVLRAKAIRDGTKVVEMSEERLKDLLDDILGMYADLIQRNNFEVTDKKRELLEMRRANTAFNKLLSYKEKLYPTVQKTVNVQVDFNKLLEDWRDKRKEIVVMGEKEKKKEEEDGEDE